MIKAVIWILATLSLSSFRFQDKFETRQCRIAGGLEFCILAQSQSRYGVMPAVFVRGSDGSRSEIWRDRDRGFRPWKLMIAELDGDPQPEIAIGVYKKTRYDPVFDNRLFIYDWTGNCLSPKWLGSRLALPWEDFKFARPSKDGIDHLFALESGPAGKLIRKYRWNGFGFTGVETWLQSGPGTTTPELIEAFQGL